MQFVVYKLRLGYRVELEASHTDCNKWDCQAGGCRLLKSSAPLPCRMLEITSKKICLGDCVTDTF